MLEDKPTGFGTSAFGYTLVAIGIALSFFAATVPFHSAAYKLLFELLICGVSLYLAFALWVALWPQPSTNALGLIFLILHATVVLYERFVVVAGYPGPAV